MYQEYWVANKDKLFEIGVKHYWATYQGSQHQIWDNENVYFIQLKQAENDAYFREEHERERARGEIGGDFKKRDRAFRAADKKAAKAADKNAAKALLLLAGSN